MTFEDRLFAWHRLYSDLQDTRSRLQEAAASDLQQLRERADRLDEQSAAAMQEVERARAAELQRASFWRRQQPQLHAGSGDLESRAGDSRERTRSRESSRPG
jgi:multidrug resistance efflux pump